MMIERLTYLLFAIGTIVAGAFLGFAVYSTWAMSNALPDYFLTRGVFPSNLLALMAIGAVAGLAFSLYAWWRAGQ